MFVKSLAGAPLKMPLSPAPLSAPVGGRLATIAREGVTLSWGAARHLAPPTHDLAVLTPQHLALATARGVEVWEAQGGERGGPRGALRRVLRLDLGAPVTRLLARREALYILCPSRGLYWARLTRSP